MTYLASTNGTSESPAYLAPLTEKRRSAIDELSNEIEACLIDYATEARNIDQRKLDYELALYRVQKRIETLAESIRLLKDEAL